MNPNDTHGEIRPIVASDDLIARLRVLDNAKWPVGLNRFAPFSLSNEDGNTAYIAVAWQPGPRVLHVQKIELGENPPRSRMPTPISVDSPGWAARVALVKTPIRPAEMMLPFPDVPVSMLENFERRMMLIRALVMVDTVGDGDPLNFFINDYIFTDPSLRSKRIEQMKVELGAGKGFRSYMGRLFTRYMWYGGGEHSMLARTKDRGGRDNERFEPACKPGRLSAQEMLNRAKAAARGSRNFRRGKRTTVEDIQKFTEALKAHWASGDRLSVAATHQRMVEEQYAGRRAEEIPSLGRMRYRSMGEKGIVAAQGLLAIRLGREATAQYLAPRTGNSSDLTEGALEILDVDGFRPKIPIGALVEGKLVPVDIWVIFAVSRSSGAIRGYDISLEGERATSYLRCLVSALLGMDEQVTSLGLAPLPGLVHGNFDGIFVDNGAGKSKAVRRPVTKSMGGIMFNPPGARGDLKPVGERMNRTFIHIVAQETPQGFTRDKSLLEKIKRRIRAGRKPIPIDDFERLLLKTISFINTTSNRKKLRTAQMRKAGVGISPAAIHEYNQRMRFGEAARVRSADEVFDIFLPWEPFKCSGGNIHYKSACYSSTRLEEIAAAHSKIPGKNAPLLVEIKRVKRLTSTVLCRHKGEVFELEMSGEDLRRFGVVTWKQQEFAVLDETILGGKLQKASSKLSGKLKSTKQEQVDAIERGRGNVYAAAIGSTKTRAKQSGAAYRESQFEERQRIAHGLPPSSSSLRSAKREHRVADTAIDDPLAVAAMRAEEEYRKTN